MKWPFVKSPNFYKGRRRISRVLIVMHSMEAPDGPRTAENVAQFFAKKSTKTSAHFCVDKDSIVQCVSVNDTAWHCPHANSDGIGIEQAGFARLTRQQWLAEDGVLSNAALVAAEMVKAVKQVRGISMPLRRLTVPEIKSGFISGFVGHRDVTAAYTPGGHTDPGPNYPWDVFFPKVTAHLANPKLEVNWR